MIHLLYMAFINTEFKSKEMSLLFIIVCRFTYFLTPFFVSIYDRRLSITEYFAQFKRKSCPIECQTQRSIKTKEDQETAEICLTPLFEINKNEENYRFDIHE